MSLDPQPLNPYAVNIAPTGIVTEENLRLALGQTRGMIGQIPILGVLMIVHGVVDLLMAIICGGYAIFLPDFMRQVQAQAVKQGGQATPMPPEAMFWMTFGFGFVAVLALVVGVLTIYSGINVMRFRGRMTAIVSLGMGLAMIATCYCFPTSLALSIYGLITLLNPSVKLGFELAKQGRSPRDIQRSFAMLP
jgi:hypothetical protein